MELCVESLGKCFGTHWVVRALSFVLPFGSALRISGENGTGKSTLCQLLLGFEYPTEGRIQWTPITKKDEPFISFAAPYVELPKYMPLSKLVRLQYPLSAHSNQLMNNLKELGIQLQNSQAIGEYSSGIQQKIQLAFTLSQSKPILILDEPETYLDRDGYQWLKEKLRQLKGRRTIIIASNQSAIMPFEKHLRLLKES